MKLISEVRHSAKQIEAIFVWLGLSLALPLMTGLLATVGPPALSEVLFGTAPVLALGLMVTLVVLVLIGRMRSEQALMAVLWMTLVVTAVAMVFGVCGFWAANATYSVLKPAEAVWSGLSLGLWPFRAGSEALVRFMPLIFAAGTVWALRRQRLQASWIAVSAGLVFVLLAFVSGSMSWAALILSWSRHIALEDAQDVYRLLVSTQSGGYWVSGQADRFFSSPGRQAETGLMAARAALMYLAICGAGLVLAWKRLPSFGRLAKRFITLKTGVLVSVFCSGLGLGWIGRPADKSYTSLLSFCVAACAASAWIYWRRFVQDLENLPKDELRSPHLPLPSGAIAPHELEDANQLLLVFALFGAALLGWPVLAGFLAATFFTWCALRGGLDWGSGLVGRVVLMTLTAFVLGQAGVAFGLRNYGLAAWQVWALAGAALLGGLVILASILKNLALSQAWAMALPAVGLLLPLVIIRQPVVWGLGIAAIFGQLAVGYKSEWWSRYAYAPTYALLLIFAVFSVFWPTLWVTY